MAEEDHSIPKDALAGLADRWESFAPIRQRFREEGGLLLWPSKDTVGVPSMKLEHFQHQTLELYVLIGKERHLKTCLLFDVNIGPNIESYLIPIIG